MILPVMLSLVACNKAEVQVSGVVFVDNESLVLEKTARISLTAASSVAIACAPDDDPDDLLLVESTESATAHQLVVGGLLASRDYSCTVAPTGVEVPAPITVTFRTDALPPGVPTSSAEGDNGGHYTLYSHQRLCEDDDTSMRLVMTDDEGAVRWYYELPFPGYADMGAEYYGEGLILWGGVSSSPPGEGAPRLVDLSHRQVYLASYEGAKEAEYHHMAEQLDDGTVLTLTTEPAVQGEVEWTGFGVHRVDVDTDELLWSWEIQQAVDNGELAASELDDWGANWAGVMDDGLGEVVIVSLCEDFRLLAIDTDQGSIRWSLGAEGTLDLIEGSLPECQHGGDIDGERLLLYDNAHRDTTSRAVEYEIDAEQGIAAQTWEWSESGWKEFIWGDVDYWEDRVLITRGHVECFTGGEGPSQVVEVDRSDDSVPWRLSLDDSGDGVYASDRIDGCEVFGSTRRCEQTAERLAELAEPLGLE